MLKILVIDRCHFTRTGIEAWLNHSGLFNGSFLVSGLNNLLLAKEHILQWKPHLIIADLYSFLNDSHPFQSIDPFFMACGMAPLILLQSGGEYRASAFSARYSVHTVLSKKATLYALSKTIHAALRVRPLLDTPKTATSLLTPQEEKVLTMWMEGVGNNAIASALGIHGKTVYTYKRNIRMKLHMDNRYSLFLSLPER